MFEYTALVDAPVQRFTAIVTDSDPVAEQVVVTADAPSPPMAEHATMPDPSPDPAVRPHVAPTRALSRRTTYTPADRPSKPAFGPALLAIVAAGVTAMWWLRRDSHDRSPGSQD